MAILIPAILSIAVLLIYVLVLLYCCARKSNVPVNTTTSQTVNDVNANHNDDDSQTGSMDRSVDIL